MGEQTGTKLPRWVKIDPGTQVTFRGALHVKFHQTQSYLIAKMGGEKLHFPAGLMKEWTDTIALENDAETEAKKSLITDQLKAKDRERDDALKHIFGMIRAQLYSPSEATREAARKVDVRFKNFRYIRHESFQTESAHISALLMDAEDHKAELETLGLTTVFKQLEAANEAYNALVQQRAAEKADLRARLPSMRRVRPKTDELYELICQYVQAAYLFAEKDEDRAAILRLVNYMNQTTKDFKTTHRKSTSQKRRHKKVTSDESPVTSDELRVTSDEHS